MKIAVTSQNRKTITGHAGKCRKFWVYDVEGREVRGKSLLELPIEQSFHESHGAGAHPLDDANVLISGGMGAGLQHRLRQRGMDALVTPETDPDRAVAAYLSGSLSVGEPEAQAGHEGHGHEHHHGQPHHAGIVHVAGPGIPIINPRKKEA
jgi:predicted Fe-Mo cluster-binding NifX family protein